MIVTLLAFAGAAGLAYWFWRIRRNAADEACVLRAVGNLSPHARITEIHEEFLRIGARNLSMVVVGVHLLELQHRGLIAHSYGEPLWANGPRPELFSANEKPAAS